MAGARKKAPEGWMDYQALGDALGSHRIVAFKEFNQRERFSPELLLQMLSEKGLRLGIVLDLTNTLKYYKPDEFLSRGVEHVKIMCPGQAIPSERVVQQFKDAVGNFLASNEDPRTVVGVHCTHGVNRTGYLVCRYLVDCCGLDGSDALDMFQQHRPPGIQRQNYVEDLRERKSERPISVTTGQGPQHRGQQPDESPAPTRHNNARSRVDQAPHQEEFNSRPGADFRHIQPSREQTVCAPPRHGTRDGRLRGNPPHRDDPPHNHQPQRPVHLFLNAQPQRPNYAERQPHSHQSQYRPSYGETSPYSHQPQDRPSYGEASPHSHPPQYRPSYREASPHSHQPQYRPSYGEASPHSHQPQYRPSYGEASPHNHQPQHPKYMGGPPHSYVEGPSQSYQPQRPDYMEGQPHSYQSSNRNYVERLSYNQYPSAPNHLGGHPHSYHPPPLSDMSQMPAPGWAPPDRMGYRADAQEGYGATPLRNGINGGPPRLLAPTYFACAPPESEWQQGYAGGQQKRRSSPYRAPGIHDREYR